MRRIAKKEFTRKGRTSIPTIFMSSQSYDCYTAQVDGLVSIAIVLGGLAQFVVAVLLIAVLWYLIGILKGIRAMIERFERGSELIADDLFKLHRAAKDQSVELWEGMKAFFRYIPHALSVTGDEPRKRARSAKRKEREPEEETDVG